MAKEEKLNIITPDIPCKDYPGIMQCSTACMNCRYNMFVSKVKQICRTHTADEAQRKGAPQVAPPEHLHNWLNNVHRHELEKELQSQQNQESCSN